MEFSEELASLVFSSNPKFSTEPQTYKSELETIDSLTTSLRSGLGSPLILSTEVEDFPKAIVFVDSSVEDYSVLAKTVPPGTEVIVLDSAKDGVEQISELLSQRQGVSAVHILSHGQPGSLTLGTADLSLESLDKYKQYLDEWGDALTAEGDLLFFGCNVAQGKEGQAFVEQLSDFSRADVAASTDLTGSDALGGDWDLEMTTGAIEASLPFDSSAIAEYQWLLPSYVDAGSKVAVVEVGGAWTQGTGFLEQTGTNKYLYAGETIPAGDFTINSRLSLQTLNGTAASFEIQGNRFGFDSGTGKEFFTEGSDFGPVQKFGLASNFITPGTPFDLTVKRVGSNISFSINGNQIATETLSGSLNNVGFRPWRNTMRLFEFERQDTAPPSNRPPTITSNGGGNTANLSVPEEQKSVTTVQATDPDGNSLTYGISSGTDKNLFNINASTGVLSFINAPDFENPADANRDNIYQVQVQAGDGNSGFDTQDLSITVTNINESGTITDYIAGGSKVDVVEVGGTWTQGNGFIEQTGINKYLYAGETIPAGDFTINSRLSLQTLNGTAASFEIQGNRFGFDSGTGKEFFTEGSDFGPVQKFGLASNFITPGTPFDLTVKRVGSNISFSINGNQIATETFSGGSLNNVGFRPWRNTMRLFEFEREGAKGFDSFFDKTTAFQNTTSNVFRIPAIVRANNGDLLAFAERRESNGNDFGNIDIVLKRSTDDGLTWGPLTVVADNGNFLAGNPSPVVTSGGKILLVYNTGNRSENDLVSTGQGAREVFVVESTDNGLNWTNRRNITTSVHRPFAPEINPNYTFSEDWRWNAVGPGHAIQLDNGRLLFGANYKPADGVARAYSFYSDDGGVTWQTSDISRAPGVASENQLVQLVELRNGVVMMNARPYRTDSLFRRVAYSTDNGESWTPFQEDTELPDPRVQGSIIRFTKSPPRLLFSNPASQTTARENLTVRLSYDEGDNWTDGKTVEPGPSAYSDLVIQKDNDIGLLYEDNTASTLANRKLTYAQFDLAWLTDGQDSLTT
jgi:sialidase-1